MHFSSQYSVSFEAPVLSSPVRDAHTLTATTIASEARSPAGYSISDYEEMVREAQIGQTEEPELLTVSDVGMMQDQVRMALQRSREIQASKPISHSIVDPFVHPHSKDLYPPMAGMTWCHGVELSRL